MPEGGDGDGGDSDGDMLFQGIAPLNAATATNAVNTLNNDLRSEGDDGDDESIVEDEEDGNDDDRSYDEINPCK